MPASQQYSSTAIQTNLTASITNVATSANVASTSGFPAVPFTIAIDVGTATQELCDVTNVSALTLTITRAVDGSTAQAHSNAATVTHAAIGRDFRESRTHLDSTGAVHGLTGSIVGTTDTQTLSNKTLTTPVINGTGGTLTIPAGPDTLVGRATTDTLTNKTLTSPTISGSGTFAGSTVTATSTITGNPLVASGLTGATTASRYVGATAGGPPTSGTFSVGDWIVDTAWGIHWTCVVAGTPGTWNPSGMATLGTVSLGSAGTVTFSPIPGYFTNLRIEYMATSSDTGGTGWSAVGLQLNGDTGSNYSHSYYYMENSGTVSSVVVSATTLMTCGESANGNASPASANSTAVIDFPYYSVASVSKIVQFQTKGASGVGAPNNHREANGGGIWGNSSAAITSILLKPQNAPGTFTSGSKFILYGF